MTTRAGASPWLRIVPSYGPVVNDNRANNGDGD